MEMNHVEMDHVEIVKRLREHVSFLKKDYETEIMKLSTLKDAHVYCVINKVSPQQYGPLLEKFIRIKFGYHKNQAKDCTGDVAKSGENSEIKVSLGGAKHNKFNYVQIRLSHQCNIYIFTAYHLSAENVDSEGELYIFKVPKDEIKKIILSSGGGYAHRTIKELGEITMASIDDETISKEYAIRPFLNDKCWNTLMPFRVPESEL